MTSVLLSCRQHRLLLNQYRHRNRRRAAPRSPRKRHSAHCRATRLCAAHLSIQGNQPDRRRVFARLRPHRLGGKGGETAALQIARRIANLPAAVCFLERQIGNPYLDIGRMGRRHVAAGKISVAVRLFYLNELLVKLLARDDPHPALFDHYVAAMNELAHDEPAPIVLRKFERALLKETGVATDFTVCRSTGNAVDPLQTVWWTRRAARALRAANRWPSVSGKTLLDMEQMDYSDGVTQAQSKALMRFVGASFGGMQLNTRQILMIDAVVEDFANKIESAKVADVRLPYRRCGTNSSACRNHAVIYSYRFIELGKYAYIAGIRSAQPVKTTTSSRLRR